MPQLFSKTKNQILLTDLKIAKNFTDRGIGLIGTQQLTDQQGLWIFSCNWIHTFFMSISIDCIFLDKNMRVCDLKSNLTPWKVAAPVWRADSVIEIKAGLVEQLKISIGEELYVGT